MSQGTKSFLDGKTLFAIAITVGILFLWQSYMAKKYPQTAVEAKKSETLEEGQSIKINETEASNKVIEPKSKSVRSNVEFDNKAIRFESEEISFEINSLGMGLSNIVLHKYTDRNDQAIVMSNFPKESSFANYFSNSTEKIPFDLKKISENVFLGTYSKKGVTVSKKMEIFPESYSVNFEINIKNLNNTKKLFGTVLVDKLNIPEPSSFFSPTYNQSGFYTEHASDEDRDLVTSDEPLLKRYQKASLVSIGEQYFAMGLVDQSAIIPDSTVYFEPRTLESKVEFQYPMLEGVDKYKIIQKGYLGPKNLSMMSKVDSKLTNIIDLGFFGWIAKPLLNLLKFFYGMVGNYGWAIILMTLLVRLLVLPFNLTSYKSMKKMQVLQPYMKAVREKHKDDPQRMNKEIMLLMREHKANPLGGCLPMFIQLPIFIALYQVLGNAIELYQAPFIFWIYDLSLKDPYYVIPILMGITMFIQQKITPTTMDPAQAKILMFMPIMFTVFMLALPSGLTLYIFISTLFGIIQQMLFLRDTKGKTQAIKVRAQ